MPTCENCLAEMIIRKPFGKAKRADFPLHLIHDDIYGPMNVRYKARLVAKGVTQEAVIAYEETFSPFVKFTLVLLLLAIVARLNLELHQMNVKTTFLNGKLNEEICMEQPVGFIVKGQEKKIFVMSYVWLGGINPILEEIIEKVVKRIFRYLKETADYSLCYSRNDLYLRGYTNAD
ncbi:uncharacterized protein [Nicotiana tomentosiformis]|uniref:uncharacterized protein n=1 Tax=Nicotiana tomentosiformis TaxID=4098 RepID=UPI00388C88FC